MSVEVEVDGPRRTGAGVEGEGLLGPVPEEDGIRGRRHGLGGVDVGLVDVEEDVIWRSLDEFSDLAGI